VHDLGLWNRCASARRRKGEYGTPQGRFAEELHDATFRKLVRRRNRAKCL